MYVSDHVAQDYHRGMEDMRRHMEGEMKEMEDKMKTIVKLMVLKERPGQVNHSSSSMRRGCYRGSCLTLRQPS